MHLKFLNAFEHYSVQQVMQKFWGFRKSTESNIVYASLVI